MVITLILPIVFILIWSSGSIFVNMGLQFADPFSFLFFRAVLTTLILFIILNLKKHSLRISSNKLINIFLSLWNHISPSLMIIILSGQPILTALLMHAKLNFKQILGLIFGVIGLIFVMAKSFYSGVVNTIGVFYALIALLSFTVGTIRQKRISENIPLITNLFLQYLFSSIIFAMGYGLFPHKYVHWNHTFLASLFWLVLVISIAATYLLYFLIDKINLTQVSNYFYCIPPVTMILDYMIFHNPLSVMIIFGMSLILVGQFLVRKADSKHIFQKAQ
jgi:drug/metabolite transporter (DMT)-like permease